MWWRRKPSPIISNCCRKWQTVFPSGPCSRANGYGIGVLPLARHLAEAGIDHFCVTEVREAELLREKRL